jgi:glutamate formiminotransferase / formiminotetrahydrofolate cyclodeaminase
MAPPLVECVPNFSEGRDRGVIEAIGLSISAVPGVSLLDIDSGIDANRSVYSFVGSPDAVVEAAVAAARAAFGLIDMARHRGVHPRMGALDVCPFVPLSGMGMASCVELSKRAAGRIAGELGVPVYLYEASASRPERRSLAYLRSGEYEALPAKLGSSEWAPDYGPASFVPSWGATAVGAREFLIAYNVNLDTRDGRLAAEIAGRLRESGRVARDARGALLKDASGIALRIPGRFKDVRAIGWYIEAYGCAQVSFNILDYRIAPLHAVFEAVREEAESLGLRVTGSEIVGLVPLEPILLAGRHFHERSGLRGRANEGAAGAAGEGELIGAAVAFLGLDSVAPFESDRKIVEYAAAMKAAPPRTGAKG